MSTGIIAGNVAGVTVVDLSLTPAIVATITAAEQTFTLSGAKVGDFVVVNPPSHVAGVTIGGCRVSAANTLAIQWVNPTAAGVTPPAGTYKVTLFRQEGSAGARMVMT